MIKNKLVWMDEKGHVMEVQIGMTRDEFCDAVHEIVERSQPRQIKPWCA